VGRGEGSSLIGDKHFAP
jgi:hypothetical protein